jgi:hypothetical protein
MKFGRFSIFRTVSNKPKFKKHPSEFGVVGKTPSNCKTSTTKAPQVSSSLIWSRCKC